MSRRNYLIIIAIAFVAVFGGLLVWYLTSSKPSSTASSTAGLISPFGTAPGNRFVPASGTSGTNSGNPFGTSSANVAAQAAVLSQIYTSPVSGFVFYKDKNRGDVLRFIDRGVGNAYEYLPASATPPTRLTNTTLPKIEEALFAPSGTNVILRTLENDSDTIGSFSGIIKAPATSSSGVFGELDGTNLPDSIAELAVDPLGTTLFQLFEKDGGAGSYGMTSALDGSKKSQVFDSEISGWNISWPKESTMTFTTKGSFATKGFLFFRNTTTGKMTQILGGLPGLSTLTNGSATYVAYSQSAGSGFSLNIYDVKAGQAENFSVPTLADKCVWGAEDDSILYCALPTSVSADEYPDAWYRGEESFADDIWKIDAKNGTAGLLYQMASNGTASVDASDLAVSPDDGYLAFMNKDDSSLWLLDLGALASSSPAQSQ